MVLILWNNHSFWRSHFCQTLFDPHLQCQYLFWLWMRHHQEPYRPKLISKGPEVFTLKGRRALSSLTCLVDVALSWEPWRQFFLPMKPEGFSVIVAMTIWPWDILHYAWWLPILWSFLSNQIVAGTFMHSFIVVVFSKIPDFCGWFFSFLHLAIFSEVDRLSHFSFLGMNSSAIVH